MTKNEITEVFDIPLTTLYDWEKETHSKNKLYTLLSRLTKQVAHATINKQEETHRILHILNKNIAHFKGQALNIYYHYRKRQQTI